MHEARDGVLGRGVLVVLDALEQRVGAVADADDGDAHLVLRGARLAVLLRHGVLSFRRARHGEAVRKCAVDEVVDARVLAAGVLLQLVLESVRDAQEDDRARTGKRAPAAGRREGDVERVGEEADGDIVQAGAAPRRLPNERLLQRTGHPHEEPFARTASTQSASTIARIRPLSRRRGCNADRQRAYRRASRSCSGRSSALTHLPLQHVWLRSVPMFSENRWQHVWLFPVARRQSSKRKQADCGR